MVRSSVQLRSSGLFNLIKSLLIAASVEGFHHTECMKALCCLLKYLCMLPRFLGLLAELIDRSSLAFLQSNLLEFGIHLIGLVEFAFDGNLQQSLNGHFLLRIDEIQMRKGMPGLLMRRLLEKACNLFVTELAGDFCKIQILTIGHRFTRKRSHQVLLCSGLFFLTHDSRPPC